MGGGQSLARRISRAGPLLTALCLQGGVALIPLFLVPFLGRRLGVEGFGLFAIAQAVSIYVMALSDFGFSLSGSRAIAQHQNDAGELAAILADVTAAKLIVAAVIIVALLALFPFFPIMYRNPVLFVSAITFGLGQGMSLYWFFGGQQRQRFGSIMDFSARLSAALAIVIFVRSPSDVSITMACFALAQVAWLLVSFVFAYRRTAFRPLSLKGGLKMLGLGRYMFAQNAIGIIYNSSTALLMGMVARPDVVGILSGAERLARAPLLLMTLCRQVLFPIMVGRLAHRPETAPHLWRWMFFTGCAAGVAGAVLLYVFAPEIVRIMLGPAFSEAVPVLRLMAFLPLAAVISEVFATYWLLPNHCDRALTWLIAGVTVLHIVLVVVFGLQWGALGGAAAILASQFAAALLGVVLTMTFRPRPL